MIENERNFPKSIIYLSKQSSVSGSRYFSCYFCTKHQLITVVFSLANGFQKLLVSDPDDSQHTSPNRRDSRGSHRQGPSRDAQGHSREPHWNSNRHSHGDQRYNFIPRSVQGAHTNEVFSNRYNSVTSSVLGQGQTSHSTHVSHSRNVGEHGVGQSYSSGQNNHVSGIGRDGRRHQSSGSRNAGLPVPSSHLVRGFNGHCFICGE